MPFVITFTSDPLMTTVRKQSNQQTNTDKQKQAQKEKKLVPVN